MDNQNLSGGPINPTNPNALENHPGENGNATPVTNSSTTNEKPDSNGAAGDPVEQSVKEPSLASKPEAVGYPVEQNEGQDIDVNNGPGPDFVPATGEEVE